MTPSIRHFLFTLCLMLSAHTLSAQQPVERSFKVITASYGLADNSAQIVKCTMSGRIIIATIGNLNFYDGKTFTHADVQPVNEYPLPLYHGHYHMYFDGLYHIWLKDKMKVTCLDMMTENFVANVDSLIRSLGCHERVLDFFTDQYSNLWFLTAHGLYNPRLQRTLPVQRNRSLQDVDMMGSTIYTFYDNGEVVGLDTLGNVVSQAKAYQWDTAQHFAESSVLLPYSDGFFHIRNGQKGGILLYFDTANNTYTELLRPGYHLNNMVLDPSRQHLYIPAEHGYWIYTPSTGDFHHVEHLLLNNGTSLSTDCNTLAFDHQGGLWIGTEKQGVLYARPHSMAIMAYPPSHPQAARFLAMTDTLQQTITEYAGKKAFCKIVDSRGWTWIGTRTGIYCERPGEAQPRSYGKGNGLNNEVVHALVEDHDHNIWAATSCGISFLKIEQADGTARPEVTFVNNFTADDNVPAESFENSKALCTDSGTIVVKGVNHIVVIDPDRLHQLNSQHPVNNITPKLVRIMVNGNTIMADYAYDGNIIIDRVPSRVTSIALNSDQNSISLFFSALNYSRPLQTYYRVRVAELDNQWHVYSHQTSNLVDNMGQLRYSMANLQPGNYHVEVQTSMFPDLWDEEKSDSGQQFARQFVWEVSVKQPWWRTTGIFYLMGFVLLALLVANFLLYNRNTRMRDRRNLEEADIIRKIRFFVEQCNELSTQKLTILQEHTGADKDAQLSKEFINLMMKLIPHVGSHDHHQLTMRQLSTAAGTDVAKLYDTVIGNLHKNPRQLVKLMKLRRGAELLAAGMPTEQVAAQCGFGTVNYFMGSFFHAYKLTPDEYRSRCASLGPDDAKAASLHARSPRPR